MRKVGSRIAITLTLIAMTWTVSSQQVKRSIGSDAPRIQHAAPADSNTLATRQRFLEMFARAYFPGRTGQLLIVPREGDFITRPDVAYMHGSPWIYDVAIPLMFAGPAVRTGTYSTPAVQQDVAPTLAAALGVQMPPTTTGHVLPVLRTGLARPRAVMLLVLGGMARDHLGTGQHRPSGDAARRTWSVSVEWSACRSRKLRSGLGQLDHKPQLFPAACVSEGSQRENIVAGERGVDGS